MKRFIYNITKHPAELFNEVIYFCSESGECTLEQIPREQTEVLQGILNKEGDNGWELVQISFGGDGIMAFWKKESQA